MRRTTRARQTFERITSPPAAPRLIADGVEVTDDGLWAWAQIPAGSTYLLEDDDLTRATWDTSAAMASLLPAGAEYHIKVMWAGYSADDYITSWASLQTVRAPGADAYVDLGARRITRNTEDGHFRRRIVLLGLRWPEGNTVSAADRVGRSARRRWRSPNAAHKDAHERMLEVSADIDRWFGQLNRSPLRGVQAPAGLIAWAFAREMRRVPIDAPGEAMLAGPVLVDLMQGVVNPTVNPNYVVVTDLKTGARQFVTVLSPAVNGFPVDELEIPGGEWLEMLTELPGVEASVRGINHGQAGSIAMIDQGRKLTRSQSREAETHGAHVPLEVAHADEALNLRRQEITRRQDVMTTNHARWVIAAADPEELEDRIAELRDRYTGVLRLEVVPHVQGLLWQELLPGDRVRVPEFGQHQPMRTLAGSWFHGGSTIGDSTGPYFGANLGSTPGPVQCHIVSRAASDRSRPTTISFTGQSGSGKSTAVMMALLGALAEGAWTLLVDPKGDLGGVVDVAQRLLQVPVQVVDVLDPAASGTMDPMRFAPGPDLARSLTLDAFLGALSTDDRRRGEVVLEGAIDAVLHGPKPAWSAQTVIAHLLATPEAAPHASTARELGQTLAVRSKQAQMRAVLGPMSPHAQPLLPGRGLVYLGLAGLDLPRHNPDPDKWTVAERCSMTTFRVSLGYALQQSNHVRQLKKLVALTELHLITGYPEGKAFVEWLARTGRALQTWLLLDTQAAADLAVLTGLVEQIVMSFAFRASGRDEQDAQAVLLKRPDPGPRLRLMQASLGTGDAIMLDRHGAIAPIHVDLMAEWIAAALSTDAEEDSPTAPQETDEAATGPDTVVNTHAGADDATAPTSTRPEAESNIAGPNPTEQTAERLLGDQPDPPAWDSDRPAVASGGTS